MVLVFGLASSTATTKFTTCTLHVTDDIGFKQVGTESFFGINSLVACDSSLILSTNDNLFCSTNEGKTWFEIATHLTHKNVVSVIPRSDTLFVGTSNGSIHRSTDHGLTWTQIQRQPTMEFPAHLVLTGHTVRWEMSEPSVYVAELDGDSALVSESELQIRNSNGSTVSFNADIFANTSAVFLTDTLAYVGLRRDGLVTVNRNTGEIRNVEMGTLDREFVSAIAVWHGYLYIGLKYGRGGVYRQSLTGTTWHPLNSDREFGVMDVNVIAITEQDMYVGMREHGLSRISPHANVMRAIHNGLVQCVNQAIIKRDSSYVVVSRLQGLSRIRDCGKSISPLSNTVPVSTEYIGGAVGKSLVLCVAGGDVFRSDDDGLTWFPLGNQFPNASLSLFHQKDSTLYASTTNGVLVSTDTSRTWTAFHPDLANEAVMNFVPLDSGYIIMAASQTLIMDKSGVIRTFDPGMPSEYQPRISDAVQHNGVVYASGYPGLFTSTDNARTWKTQVIPKQMVLRTSTIVGKEIYVVSDNGQILKGTLP